MGQGSLYEQPDTTPDTGYLYTVLILQDIWGRALYMNSQIPHQILDTSIQY
jgi:hypothetical protein